MILQHCCVPCTLFLLGFCVPRAGPHGICPACCFAQGLPATVTSLLSLTALRLRDKQVLIKRTDIIENLGNATIIASDKTGTLTQNRMTVENLWCNMVSVDL